MQGRVLQLEEAISFVCAVLCESASFLATDRSGFPGSISAPILIKLLEIGRMGLIHIQYTVFPLSLNRQSVLPGILAHLSDCLSRHLSDIKIH